MRERIEARDALVGAHPELAVVIREQDGSFVLLKRDATPPVVLSPYIGEDRGPYATFHAARKRLYELRDAAKVSSRKLGNMG